MNEDYTILTVDDDDDTRQYFKTVLENNGYNVIEASNGRLGVEAVKSENPDLVLLDLMMPEMTGSEALRAH